MVFIVVTGSIAVVSIKAEVFPEMELDGSLSRCPTSVPPRKKSREAVNIRIEEAVQASMDQAAPVNRQ